MAGWGFITLASKSQGFVSAQFLAKIIPLFFYYVYICFSSLLIKAWNSQYRALSQESLYIFSILNSPLIFDIETIALLVGESTSASYKKCGRWRARLKDFYWIRKDLIANKLDSNRLEITWASSFEILKDPGPILNEGLFISNEWKIRGNLGL
jgi:hypothetical protein